MIAMLSTSSTKPLFGYKPFWAKRLGTAHFLPTTREEMDNLGWDSCDIIIVTGDAYIDHPSFGMAIIGRLLEAQGFRVGIIDQPDWKDPEAFRQLGKPNLFFGVAAGNMDSLVNHYTSDRKVRSNDAYTPHGVAGKRPDRAVIVYAQKAKEAFKGVPIIIGGIEASLRRIAHYDYWQQKVRRSILPDSKADMLIFGNAERAIVELAHRLSAGEKIADITDIRGTGYMRLGLPNGWLEIDSTDIDQPGRLISHESPYQEIPDCELKAKQIPSIAQPEILIKRNAIARANTFIRLPSYNKVIEDKMMYAHASRIFHLETNPGNARALVQKHGNRFVWLNPTPVPLSTPEMDGVFDLPYARAPHPKYENADIPAWEMIRHSINIMRGCFGGCTFCSITEHEGRIIQSRSEDSIIKEIEAIRDTSPNFTGSISDLGGPTANMYRLQCKTKKIESSCRRLSCVFPGICKNLNTNHKPLIKLYRRARNVPGIKKIYIASGLRYDLALQSPEYIKELVTHHVGGYLKIAPEHTSPDTLNKMMKPGIGIYDEFKKLFEKYSKQAGKEQYLIPYFISAHPGSTEKDMMHLALWLKKNNFRLDQVQAFLPTPLAIASAMYHTEQNPLQQITRKKGNVFTAKSPHERRLQKAFLRYHDPENWDIIRKSLKGLGRTDLIGSGKKHLVPAWNPQSKEPNKKTFGTKKKYFNDFKNKSTSKNKFKARNKKR
jgi:uncharacterized radical SAM protein YgiQ